MVCSLSTNLNEEKLNSIKALEQEIGSPLLAFSCHDLNPVNLEETQIQKVQDLESKLGIVLVAIH